MTRRAFVALCIALAFASSACAGPSAELEVGVKEIDTDVLIGPSASGTPVVPPSSAPPPGFPGFVQPPTIFPPVVESPRPVACPSAHPLAPIEHAVITRANKAPAATGYSYRNTGRYTIGDRSGTFPERSTRVIGNVTKHDAGDFTFETIIDAPDESVTTTTYHVYPTAADPTNPEPGLYIEQIVTSTKEGSRHTFSPTPAVLVMKFPAATGATWTARGIDPLGQILMQFTGKIAGRMVVDACGERIEAWQVEITEGIIRSPSTDLRFTATLGIATQYGAVSVIDTVRQQGTDNGVAVEIENTARISEVPEFP